MEGAVEEAHADGSRRKQGLEQRQGRIDALRFHRDVSKQKAHESSMINEMPKTMPKAARLSFGSGRRAMADCTAGPSSIKSVKLIASGSHSQKTVRRVIAYCFCYDSSQPLYATPGKPPQLGYQCSVKSP